MLLFVLGSGVGTKVGFEESPVCAPRSRCGSTAGSAQGDQRVTHRPAKLLRDDLILDLENEPRQFRLERIEHAEIVRETD
mgnify:CR=1 FL=1